jgi:hypothetical protein
VALTINGVVCQEIVDQFAESFDLLEGPAARKGFLCDWTDRYRVAIGLLGYAHATAIGAGITLLVGASYPELPTLYAHDITIEPKGQPFQGPAQIAWPKCIVWANYRAMQWSFTGLDDQLNQFGGPWVFAEQQLSSSVEWITVPGRATKFAGSGKQTGQDYAFRIAICDMIVTLHRVPYLPTNQVLGLAGSINNASLFGVGTGKLLFNGCETHRTTSSDGTYNNDVTFKFAARTQRWDYAFDPSVGAWDQVQNSGGTPFVPSTDLSIAIPSVFGY